MEIQVNQLLIVPIVLGLVEIAKRFEPPERFLPLLALFLGVMGAFVFPEPTQADAWLHKPNAAPLFGGHSALERMLSGNVADLYVVRQYLDAQRG